MKETTAPGWLFAAPALFVMLWSTGFVVSKFGLPYAEPLTFLLWRFALVTLLMLGIAVLLRAPWPRHWQDAGHIAVAGLLVHAGYLSGVFVAIHQGVSAGVMALVAGLQPVLTAIVAGPLLGERVQARQWLGLVLGLAGVLMVVWQRIQLADASFTGYGFALFALCCITAGTLYQKRNCNHMDLRSGAVIQYAAATAAMAVCAPVFESMVVQWTGDFIFALTWLSLVLSVGAVTLLYLLIRHGEASKVSSLFYLVPPVTALMAWFMFEERLDGIALIGMAATVAGVALVVTRSSRR